MWNFAKSASYGGKSARRLILFVLATLVATFLWTYVNISNVYAVDANWNSESSLNYDGNNYTGPIDKDTLKKLDLESDDQAYIFIDEDSEKAEVIFFPSGKEAENAETATHKIYDYDGKDYSNPSSPNSVTIDKRSETVKTEGHKSCVLDGVGWIICPVTNFLADGMDNIFNILTGFLEVRPIQTGQNNALFRAWSYMRSFANVAFVIAFLIIIYSQITNMGISNYSVKKMLPRLIIAAILVNLSYLICALLVDVSNILGYSIQDVFNSIREGLVGDEGNTWELTSWRSITSFILTGGVATAGIATFIIANSWAGALFLLLPALVSCIIAALIALVILVGRQALITILVIISPLAFVAYLLPNTEKLFEKWKSAFMTMLILFPAFSIVFGGSQMAAAVIIQNANSIMTVILAMTVQVAPLFITPLLINMSGSILGKVAGFVNNPSRGLVDRTRNFSEDMASTHRSKWLGGEATKRSPFRRTAQKIDHNRRKRESIRKIYDGKTDNRYSSSDDNRKLYEQMYEVDRDKKYTEQELERNLHRKIRTNDRLLQKEMDTRIISTENAEAKGRVDRIEQELYAGKDTTATGALSTHAVRAEIAKRDLNLNAIANQAALRVQQANLSNALMGNVAMIEGQLIRDYAGGIDTSGADSALAFAVKERREAIGKLINERNELAKQFKLSGEQYQKLAVREDNVVGIDNNGNTYTFSVDDNFTVEMAIANQLMTGSYDEKYAIISQSGSPKLNDYRASISRAIPANGIPNSISAFGGKFINEVIKGNVKNDEDVDKLVVDFVIDGKFKAEAIADDDPGSIKLLERIIDYDTSGLSQSKQEAFKANFLKLIGVAQAIINPDPNNKLNSIAAQGTKDELEKLIRLGESKFSPQDEENNE